MEQNTHIDQSVQKRERVTKLLAIIGFFTVVILLAWVAFKAIGYIPNLLSAIGTADRDTEEQIVFTTSPLVQSIEHNETVTLEWEIVSESGTYALMYDCADGVSAIIRTETYGTQSINCGSFYNIGDSSSVMMTLTSDTDEIVVLPYTITFIPDRDPTAQYEAMGEITVINSSLAVAPPSTGDNEVVEPTPSEPTTPPSTPSTPTYTTPVYEYTYAIPVSNPAGYTDLAISLSSIGSLNSNDQFIPAGSLKPSERGAIRFTVKNTGTRTSESWTYTATLPGGRVYESPQQTALRPNETATITLGFTSPQSTGHYNFSVKIDTSRDRDRSNHLINWGLQVRN